MRNLVAGLIPFLLIFLPLGCARPEKTRFAPHVPSKRKVLVLFVATNGNDHWSGKLASPHRSGTDGPLATLPRARQRRGDSKACFYPFAGWQLFPQPTCDREL